LTPAIKENTLATGYESVVFELWEGSMLRCLVTAIFIAAASCSYAAGGDEDPATVILNDSKTLADFIKQSAAARLPKNRIFALDTIREYAGPRRRDEEKRAVAGRAAIITAAFQAAQDADSDVRIAALKLISYTVRPWDGDREKIAEQVLAKMPEEAPVSKDPFARDGRDSELIARIGCLAVAGSAKHIPPLEKIANNSKFSLGVRRSAAGAIYQIGGNEAKASLESLAKANSSQPEFKASLDGLLDLLDGFDDIRRSR
jgi:hypothetical protein